MTYDFTDGVLRSSIGKRVREPEGVLTGNALLGYFQRKFKECHGYDYSGDVSNVEFAKQRSIMGGFVKRYGPDDAKAIMDLAFGKYRGFYNGTVIGIHTFTSGSRWITDRMRTEAREEKARAKERRSISEIWHGGRPDDVGLIQ